MLNKILFLFLFIFSCGKKPQLESKYILDDNPCYVSSIPDSIPESNISFVTDNEHISLYGNYEDPSNFKLLGGCVFVEETEDYSLPSYNQDYFSN